MIGDTRRLKGYSRVSLDSYFVVLIDKCERLTDSGECVELRLYDGPDVDEVAHYWNALVTELYISHCMIALIFVSSFSIVRVKKGFAFVPFLAMLLAMTNAGIPIPFRFTQRAIGASGGILPGRRPSWTYFEYPFIFSSSP